MFGAPATQVSHLTSEIVAIRDNIANELQAKASGVSFVLGAATDADGLRGLF